MNKLVVARDIVTNDTVIFVDKDSGYDRIPYVTIRELDLIPYQSGEKNSLAEVFYTSLLITDNDLKMAMAIARTNEVHEIGNSFYQHLDFTNKEQNDEDKTTDSEGTEAECAG